MKRLIALSFIICHLSFSVAQSSSFSVAQNSAPTARDEIRQNRWLAGSNYLDYDRQLPDFKYTKAPKGYRPFYFSHYGRHGSRWLIAKDSYTRVIRPLRKARQEGLLTREGEELLRQIELFNKTTEHRKGDLTTVGERQHHGIGRRMAEHFPEIFVKTKGLAIDARSTTVTRCILSMVAECEELMAANPTARIHNDVSDSLQYYLNQPWEGVVKEQGSRTNALRYNFANKITDSERITGALFADKKWANDSIDMKPFMRDLFEVVLNMQSHDGAPDLTNIFTEDEIYNIWRAFNAGWYVNYAHSPQTGGVMAYSQYNLLRNIIETADTCLAAGNPQATLRFGHEVCVLPLACLMELDSCGIMVENLDELDQHWQNYKIFPMACNIQMIFYKHKRGQGPVLVKVLLNEREATLPAGATDTPYYYIWDDVRRYWATKLDKFKQQ